MPHGSGVRQVEVGAAAGADLDVELEGFAAGRALAFGFVLVDPVEDHRDQTEQGQNRPDHEPDEEGAALGAADDAGGEAEEEDDDEVFHVAILALHP